MVLTIDRWFGGDALQIGGRVDVVEWVKASCVCVEAYLSRFAALSPTLRRTPSRLEVGIKILDLGGVP